MSRKIRISLARLGLVLLARRQGAATQAAGRRAPVAFSHQRRGAETCDGHRGAA